MIYTGIPGHVGCFGCLVGRIGRGFVRSMTCAKEATIVATYPYEGPDLTVATRLMEEAKIREQEAALNNQRTAEEAKS